MALFGVFRFLRFFFIILLLPRRHFLKHSPRIVLGKSFLCWIFNFYFPKVVQFKLKHRGYNSKLEGFVWKEVEVIYQKKEDENYSNPKLLNYCNRKLSKSIKLYKKYWKLSSRFIPSSREKFPGKIQSAFLNIFEHHVNEIFWNLGKKCLRL